MIFVWICRKELRALDLPAVQLGQQILEGRCHGLFDHFLDRSLVWRSAIYWALSNGLSCYGYGARPANRPWGHYRRSTRWRDVLHHLWCEGAGLWEFALPRHWPDDPGRSTHEWAGFPRDERDLWWHRMHWPCWTLCRNPTHLLFGHQSYDMPHSGSKWSSRSSMWRCSQAHGSAETTCHTLCHEVYPSRRLPMPTSIDSRWSTWWSWSQGSPILWTTSCVLGTTGIGTHLGVRTRCQGSWLHSTRDPETCVCHGPQHQAADPHVGQILALPKEKMVQELHDMPHDPSLQTIDKIITVWPTWEDNTDTELRLTQQELLMFNNPNLGNDVRHLRVSDKCPCILHSYGNFDMACPCGCRSAGFTFERLLRGGLRGFYVLNGEGAPRFLHPAEASLLNTIPPDFAWPVGPRAALSMVGQCAAPIQALWIIGHMQERLQWSPNGSAEQLHVRYKAYLIRAQYMEYGRSQMATQCC